MYSLVSLAGKAVLAAAMSLSGHTYTVQPGDTLTIIAASQHVNWQAIYAANQAVLGPSPNLIRPGERLVIPGPGGIAVTAADPRQQPQGVPQQRPTGPVTTVATSAQAASGSVGSVSGVPASFQSCVISRESGGNPSAVNPSSGAGGLYQFLPSTWAALGYSGLPQNASAATQNAAFAKAYALWGTQPWAPSDGC
jgi:LysM repeat protein